MALKFEFEPEPQGASGEYMLSAAAEATAVAESGLQLIAGIAASLSEAQLRVLLFLMARAERAASHTIRISTREISSLTLVSRRNVQHAFNELERRKLIVIRRGGATSSSAIWVAFLEVRGGVITAPPPVEKLASTGAAVTPPQYPETANKERWGGAAVTPPPNLSLFSKSNDTRETLDRGSLFPQETDEAKLLARLAQARPTHFGRERIETARAYLHQYQGKLGKQRNPHPPDDQLCAQFLAIAPWPQLERTFLDLVKENRPAGSSYGWYITVFVDRIHGIRLSKVRDVAGRPLLVSAQPAATLEALSQPEAMEPATVAEPVAADCSGEESAAALCVRCGSAPACKDNSRSHCVACERRWVESWREAESARKAGGR